ncbi:DUF6404 family protein, partial [Vibrio parahaemolyticus]|uniref:DUF6404 family protein n=1 Tax=Vibrio parahaemolyticus TaxID=670 RepID=UPI001E348E84
AVVYCVVHALMRRYGACQSLKFAAAPKLLFPVKSNTVLRSKEFTLCEVVMKKAEFIQRHLIEKGVPADLTKPNSFVWSKYKDPSEKPLVFQSPIKVLMKHGLFMGLLMAVVMLIFAWHTESKNMMIYLISSCFYGICMGSINMFRIIEAQKNLGEKSWEKWCERNYE